MDDRNTETAKLKIKRELIDKYIQFAEEKRLGKYNEEQTKKDFILPLFEALGWNVDNKLNKTDSVSAEEKVSKKRVDYGFKINGIPKFFLEAKPISSNLKKTKFAEQAISYSWHKGCTWAVLTNFEGIRVFNAEWESKNINDNLFLNLSWDDYIPQFDKLWLLSKESFENGLLDREAEIFGKKIKKIPVDKQLLADFTRFREILSKDITKFNQDGGLTGEILDESVQRILDRLIFIRNCEDRELEAQKLKPALRIKESESTDTSGQLLELLRAIFRYFDKHYNSKLFKGHLCDTLYISDDVLNEVISGLYQTKDKSVHYDFSFIEADVLGNIYEQYLGHILRKTAKRAKITENHSKRKEHGIYYTPPYIVDYIVRNTLVELLKRKTSKDVGKIRVLDPACGSGSFLIKAFDILNEYWKKKDKDYDQSKIDTSGYGVTYTRKINILENNIFGVDLDKQAVEIAQLNLLLKIAEKGHRLPLLQQNIKCGNSLIGDSEVAGDKAFEWDEEFKQIMDEGGFDVIIGNPPYFNIQTIEDRLQKVYFKKEYKSYRGKADVLYFFIERANALLNEGGYFGFIVANYFLRSHYADKLRDFILKHYEVVKIIDFGSTKIFGDANVDTCILILRKLKHQKRKFLYGILVDDNQINEFLNASFKKKAIDTAKYKIINESQAQKSSLPWHFGEKNISNVVSISEICHIGKGAATGNDDIFVIDKKEAQALRFESDLIESLIDDSSIDRYAFRISDKVLIRAKRGTDIPQYPNIHKYLENHKEDLQKRYAVKNEGLRWYEIVRYNKDLFSDYVLEQIYAYYRSPHNKFAYSDKRFVTLTTTFVLTPKKTCPVEMKYLLGLLNSKFMEAYSTRNAKKMGTCFEYSSKFIGSMPIKILSKHERQPLINLVDKMLSLSKRLKDMGDKKIDEVDKIKEELKTTDAKIDEFVYALYN